MVLADHHRQACQGPLATSGFGHGQNTVVWHLPHHGAGRVAALASDLALQAKRVVCVALHLPQVVGHFVGSVPHLWRV